MADKSARNLLFFLCDALTASALGCYGNPVVETPHIDSLAAGGVRFSSATAACPYCVPSRATILAGLYPHHHGIVHNGSANDYGTESDLDQRAIVPQDVTTDRVLADTGHRVSFFGRFHLTDSQGPPRYYRRMYGERKGYWWHPSYPQQLEDYLASHPAPADAVIMEWYQWRLPTRPSPVLDSLPLACGANNQFSEKVYREFLLPMGELLLPLEMCFDQVVADLAAEEIRDGDGLFAVTCGFGAPHDPWAAPEPFYSMYDPGEIELPNDFYDPSPLLENTGSWCWARALGEDGVREFTRIYYALVSFVDHQVGRLVEALKLSGHWEDTLVVISADHGDMVGRHGLIEKNGLAHLFPDPLVQVPLILHCPDVIPPGRVIDDPVSHTDIMPTILDYLGFEVPTGIDGRSVRDLVEGNLSRPWRRYAFAAISGLSRPFDRFSEVIPGHSMIRTNQYKALFEKGVLWAVYNVVQQPLEFTNIIEQTPEDVVEELCAMQVDAWGLGPHPQQLAAPGSSPR